jgi:histidinol phosphatase-like enzyme
MSSVPTIRIFLDKDGVIKENYGCVRPKKPHFLPRIFELALAARANGYLRSVVASQIEIAWSLYGIKQFKTLSTWM